jgi:hypothetical protein
MTLQNFTSLDFDQIKRTLSDYLRSNSNFTDYNFEGSNFSTILDVLAYNTYIASYNANMVANEVFIDSATLRENIVSLARNIGYIPRSRKASTATISFFVNTENIFPTPAALTLQRGIVVSSASQFAGQSFIFSILEDVTVPVVNGIASFNNIRVYQGNLVDQNFLFNSIDVNQRFTLDNIGIDSDLLNVYVKDSISTDIRRKYAKQDSLFQINGDSRVFFIQEIEDERYEILFGDGIFGKKLQEGNYVTASYIVCDGDSANGVSSFSFSGRLVYVRDGVEYIVSNGISLVTTQIPSRGGESIESVESIKKYAPRIYSSQNRALTINDYETLVPAKIYPETESISVFGGEDLIPPQYGKVFISIKPRNGDFLPNLIKENIRRDLKKYAVAGIVPEILDLKYLYIEIESQIYYNTNLTSSGDYVSRLIQQNVDRYANSSDLNKYGARFKYSKFLKVIDDSDESVMSNITKLQMRRDLRVSLNTFAEYSIGFGNQFYISNLNGYNIKSTSFQVSGISGDVYISDIPDTNRKNGSIFLFSVPSINSTTPTIIRRNVGRIDYINGVITLNPINIIGAKVKDGQSIIEISVVPQSNDVVGYQDLYLQLDITNSVFEMVPDSISSGLDSSGSQYIVSSSYKNGNLVRN